MPTQFTITAEKNPEILHDAVNEGSAVEYSFDFTPWAQDNSDVSAVTWTVDSGQATVSGAALANGIATALVTFAQSGGSLIKVKATGSGGEIIVANLNVLARDPVGCSEDYV